MPLSDYAEQIYGCGRCGYCLGGYLDEVCPSRFIAGFESATARGRMLIARAILDRQLQYSPRLAERLYTCFLCGACNAKCELAAKIKITEITKALRSDIFSAGIELKRLSELCAVIANKHNIYDAPEEDRTTWIAPDIKIEEKADLLYFPGCVTAYRLPKVARYVTEILNQAGIKVTVLGAKEWCCGNPLLSMGRIDLAKETIMHNIEEIERIGAKQVITSCAGCYRTMTQDYPRILGQPLSFKVTHLTQFLNKLIKDGKIKVKTTIRKRITYHDPCEIGRHCNIFEQPREIVNSIPGVDLVEMERNRENAWCCGGGGSVSVLSSSLSLKVAHERLKEAQRTGATTIVTACPSCILMLDLANKRMGAKLRVIDISELVTQAMRP